MGLKSFQVDNKFKKFQFIQKTFLLANINVKIMLNILFSIFTMQTYYLQIKTYLEIIYTD